MTEQIDTTPLNKSRWSIGPWMNEPDRVEFKHAELPCLALRNHMGVWCGYAAVPPEHPLHGQSYSDIDVEVHGGLTYSDKCDGSRICHIPEPGQSGDVWWFGFDCGHAFDLVPMMRIHDNGVYRDLSYVRSEIEKLAKQLKDYK